jgi:WYL domain
MQQKIIDAIAQRRVLSFNYNGQPRRVNPHALYLEDQHRNVVLHAWQTEGTSNSRVPPCWGNFHLNKMIGLEVSRETFSGAQSDFNPGHFLHPIELLR